MLVAWIELVAADEGEGTVHCMTVSTLAAKEARLGLPPTLSARHDGSGKIRHRDRRATTRPRAGPVDHPDSSPNRAAVPPWPVRDAGTPIKRQGDRAAVFHLLVAARRRHPALHFRRCCP